MIPIIWAAATPSSFVEQQTYESIVAEILEGVKTHQIDGIYLDLHGAMVPEHLTDGEGELLQRIRQLVGKEMPIVVSLDLHANVTQKMFDEASVLSAFRTYPHVDMAQTGQRCAHVMHRLLQGDHLYRHFRRLPFLTAINAQSTFLEPAKTVYQRLAEWEKGTATSLSFAQGFPAADIAECGGTVFGYGEDEQQVINAVDRLFALVANQEAAWVVDFLPPDEAVKQAIALSQQHSGPVVIADTQDNPGAGGDSNTTGMLRALVANQASNAAIGLISDPDAVKQVQQHNVGERMTLTLGGQSGAKGDEPFTVDCRIEGFYQGKCRYDGPMMHGVLVDVGDAVRLSVGGVEIVLTSGKAQMLDRNLFKMAGIVPEQKAIVVVKSSVHFRADFQPIASTILIGKAPGPMFADPADLPWQNLDPQRRTSPLGKTRLEMIAATTDISS